MMRGCMTATMTADTCAPCLTATPAMVPRIRYGETQTACLALLAVISDDPLHFSRWHGFNSGFNFDQLSTDFDQLRPTFDQLRLGSSLEFSYIASHQAHASTFPRSVPRTQI